MTSGRASAAVIALRRVGAHDHRHARVERLPQRPEIRHAVDDERLVQRHRRIAFERELRDAAAAPPPPALPQIVTESPGSIISISTPAGASSFSFCGVPVSAGKVPQWHGTQRFVPSSSSATAASRGPMV